MTSNTPDSPDLGERLKSLAKEHKLRDTSWMREARLLMFEASEYIAARPNPPLQPSDEIEGVARVIAGVLLNYFEDHDNHPASASLQKHYMGAAEEAARAILSFLSPVGKGLGVSGAGWRDPNSGEVYTADQLAELLNERDAFIVDHGLWDMFTAGLGSDAEPLGQRNDGAARQTEPPPNTDMDGLASRLAADIDALREATPTTYRLVKEADGAFAVRNNIHIANDLEKALIALRSAEARAKAGEERIAKDYQWAVHLATVLHRQYYAEVADWRPLDDTQGVLTQIDNMAAGIASRALAAEAKLLAAEAANARMSEALEKARDMFLEYADLHAAKATEDGDRKSLTNVAMANICRTALAAPGDVGEGWVLVPREPTLEMQRAYFDSIDAHMERVESDLTFGRHDNHIIAYRAMIAASPTLGGDE